MKKNIFAKSLWLVVVLFFFPQSSFSDFSLWSIANKVLYMLLLLVSILIMFSRKVDKERRENGSKAIYLIYLIIPLILILFGESNGLNLVAFQVVVYAALLAFLVAEYFAIKKLI